MQKRYAKLNNAVLCCLLAVCLLFSYFIGFSPPSRADTTYSDVLVDLQNDSNFDVNNYPVIDTDYTLQVIQIAESVMGELFVYVYQPSGQAKDLRASDIFISRTETPEALQNYKLELINSNGVFYKYKVIDFAVRTELVRYYYITSIYRPFDSTIDTAPTDDNTITQVETSVSRLFVAVTYGDSVIYSTTDVETVDITAKTCGFIRYSNGFNLYEDACDSHYVAFSTNYDIDRLIEADVYYTSTLHSYGGGTNFSDKDLGESYVTLNAIDSASNSANGLFGHKYTWNRIQSVDEFKSSLTADNIELTDETQEKLQGKQWVLRFVETDYISGSNLSGYFWEYTEVNDVSILRLQFEVNNQLYNLGVVDNKQSGDIVPDNEQKSWFEKLLFILLIILLCVILAPFLPIIVQVLVFVLKYLFIGVWYLIKYLCIGIGYLFVGLYYALAWPFYLIFKR